MDLLRLETELIEEELRAFSYLAGRCGFEPQPLLAARQAGCLFSVHRSVQGDGPAWVTERSRGGGSAMEIEPGAATGIPDARLYVCGGLGTLLSAERNDGEPTQVISNAHAWLATTDNLPPRTRGSWTLRSDTAGTDTIRLRSMPKHSR